MTIDNFAEKIAEKIGYTIDKRLGNGDWGVTYSLNHIKDTRKKCLKITFDETEAAVANRIRKTNTKYLINYYNIYKINTEISCSFNPGLGKFLNTDEDPCFALLMEEVQLMNPKEEMCWNYIDDFYCNFFNEYFKGDVDLLECEPLVKYCKKYGNPLCMEFLTNLNNIFKEMRKFGIRSNDFHRGNVGWVYHNDGSKNITFFDIGALTDESFKKMNLTTNNIKEMTINEKFQLKRLNLKLKTFERYNGDMDDDFTSSVSVGFSGIARPIAKHIGYDIIKQIKDDEEIMCMGSGAFGVAFEIKHPKDKKSKVLKITTDHNEARNAEFLSKRPVTQYIINYYNAYEIQVNDNKRLVYAVIMDMVNKLDDDMVKFYDDNVRWLTEDDLINMTKNKFKELYPYIDIEYYWMIDSAKGMFKECDKLRYNSFGTIKNLRIVDRHSGNVGFLFNDDYRLVYFDLGATSSPDVKIKHKLKIEYQYIDESMIRKFMKNVCTKFTDNSVSVVRYNYEKTFIIKCKFRETLDDYEIDQILRAIKNTYNLVGGVDNSPYTTITLHVSKSNVKVYDN